MQMLKSRQANIAVAPSRHGQASYGFHENRLQAETLTLQQRVELPIWHPDGMRSLHDEQPYPASDQASLAAPPRDQ